MTQAELSNLIVGAIDGRRILEFMYDGALRRAEPHLLGNNQTGKLTLSAWQLSGGSAVSWRAFHVARMHDAVVTEENFDGPRAGYNPNDKTMIQVICRL